MVFILTKERQMQKAQVKRIEKAIKTIDELLEKNWDDLGWDRRIMLRDGKQAMVQMLERNERKVAK
jgi:hypothetical protein